MEMIQKSFHKCKISNVVDDCEDNTSYEDDDDNGDKIDYYCFVRNDVYEDNVDMIEEELRTMFDGDDSVTLFHGFE